MRTQALSDALPDFGAAAISPRAPKPARAQPLAEPRGSATSDAEWQARLDRAVADTEARMAASMQERHEAELERLAETHREEMESLSQDFASTMGATISARLQELEDRVVDLTATAAARLLSGVLSDELGRRSVARMAAVMRSALEDRDAVKITVRGPASLYEPLRRAMGASADRMRFVETPGADLSVSIDETVYETRLAEWSGALSEVIA
jgi:hypothetical protein